MKKIFISEVFNLTAAGQSFGEILLESKVIDQDQLVSALEEQQATGKPFSQVIVEKGYATQEDILSKLAELLGLPYVNLNEYEINVSAVALVPDNLARKYIAIPIDFDDERLVVAMADPENMMAIDDLRIVTGYDIKSVVATKEGILSAIERYCKSESMEDAFQDLDVGEEENELSKLHEISEDAPIVKLANLIITRAVKEGASDIHIEPQEKDIRVRYRIDGVLHEVMKSPKKIQPALLSRFKIIASLDIAEKRKPQDGHCGLNIAGKVVDFRVATLPTVYGERIVLRILEKESILLDLNDLGFLKESLDKFRNAFMQPYGAIFITGPTGSGKSTTLYATLNVLNTEDKNIVTIEDPVEYRLPGINQVQINARAGLSFSRGLRSILRASPDIVMVGEIRDHETAQIAIEAALTGHLVFSTLHTNDAPGAITRLTEMGIEPFLTASALSCIQAQRLARKLCSDCKEPFKPSSKIIKEYGLKIKKGDDIPTIYNPKGCTKCNDTGYKGRVGIYEVMPMSPQIEKLTVARASTDKIKKQALKEGLVVLREDGLEKVLKGITSLEEVMRVIV